ncbi:MAG: fibronectin type III domain-containing protein [Micrococcales bacterium]|nr:fibronectin type III domain-containing protein [Micrococcales bacterium]
MTLDDATFESEWDPAAAGVRLERSGAGDRQVRLTADASAPSSTTGRIRVKASGAPEAGWVKVRVIGLPKKKPATPAAATRPRPPPGSRPPIRRPTAAPTREPAAYPPPRLRPVTVTGLKEGSSQTVDLRAYLDSPLKTPQCSVDAAALESGTGVSITRSGCTVTLTARAGASPQSSFRIAVSDGPGRSANGRVTVSVLGRPGAPRAVTAEADRIAGGQARVSWQPPTSTGGSPITHYTVSWTGAGSGSKECTSSPCTITGLANGKDYTFTVTATNAVGTSAPSAPFGPVRPDVKPGAPAAPTMTTRGDGTLTVSWPAAPNKGSAITRYTVRAVGSGGSVRTATTTGATTAVLSGLRNNDSQQVSVQATNGAGSGPYGPAAAMQSAGTPPTLPAPGLTSTGAGPGVDTSSVTLTWPAADPNGPAITAYSIHRRVAGGAWGVLRQAGADARSAKDTVTFDGRRYDYAVTATSGAGLTSALSAPAGLVANGYPEAPRVTGVATPRADARVVLSVRLGKPRAGGYRELRWSSSSGATGVYSCANGCPAGGTVSITTPALPVTSQTFTVTAVNSAGSPATSGASAAVLPKALPTVVNASGFQNSHDASAVTYAWQFALQGRSLLGYEVLWPDGTIRTSVYSVSANGTYSTTYYGKNSTTYTIKVRARTDAGWGPWTAISGTSGPAIPSMNWSRGGPMTSDPACGSSCAWINVDITNWPGTVTCTFSSDVAPSTPFTPMTLTGPADGPRRSQNYYGHVDTNLSMTCTGSGHTVVDRHEWK